MRRQTTSIGIAVVAFLSVLAIRPSYSSELPAGSGSQSATQVDSHAGEAEPRSGDASAPQISSPRPSLSGQSSALNGYVWPLAKRLYEGLLLLNYVDDDLSSGARDYQSAPHTYNGHNGTDISLYHFRAMDRGMQVLAGRGGRVVSVIDGYYDRNTSMNGTQANQVVIEDETGTRAIYGHLRNGSISVKPGETVTAGQQIAMVGSSGSSTIPHLHIEFRQGLSTLVDPWSGPANPVTSLWNSQEPYVGFNPFRVMDLGMFTQSSAGGSLSFISMSQFEERLGAPVVYGANEPAVAFWFLYQGQAGNTYRVEILRPNGTLFSSADGTMSQKQQLAYQYYWWSLGTSRVPSSAYGTWTARILSNGSVQASTQFTVGATTRFAPRFYPVAGRSLRVQGSTVSDVMQVSSTTGSVSYRLNNAPSFVQLSGSTVTIPSSASLTQRNSSFQVIATDSYGAADTMSYHLVDTRVGAVTAVEETPQDEEDEAPSARLTLGPVSPNQTAGASRMTFLLPSQSHAEITVYDVSGRKVRTLLDRSAESGPGHVTWDARDDRGAPVASGVYFVKLRAQGSVLSRKLILAR